MKSGIRYYLLTVVACLPVLLLGELCRPATSGEAGGSGIAAPSRIFKKSSPV